ncbi:VOC family protein [Hydrogenophaga sp.]|uniref:VOC family protein n=1 Tax=Hydrogenophaga sp. TaxID=1904254 RepID=UPI00343AC92D
MCILGDVGSPEHGQRCRIDLPVTSVQHLSQRIDAAGGHVVQPVARPVGAVAADPQGSSGCPRAES